MRQSHPPGKVILTVVTPAYNEAQNLLLLYRYLKKNLDPLRLSWEWIVVDDHSADGTYAVVEAIVRRDERVKCIRFSKNSGSHLAVICGFRASRGRSIICLAADLQDPPELIVDMVDRWKKGVQVVWATRAEREGIGFWSIFFSRFYYFIVRHGMGLRQVPPTGADFFLMDRRVLKSLAECRVKNISLFVLISSLGLKEDFISAPKNPRIHGKSGWSLKKKILLILDTLTMFSNTIIWWVLGVGAIFCAGGSISLMEGDKWPGVPFTWAVLFTLIGTMLLIGGAFWWNRLKSSSEGPDYVIEKETKSGKKKTAS